MRRLLAILALLLVPVVTPFSLDAQPKPQPGFPQDRYTDFKADPLVTYGTLPNGVRYAIKRWEQPDNEVAIRVRFAVGSLAETDEQAGLAHFLEHMAFNGSTNVPENEFDRMLAREGLAFGPDTNAYTSFDETVYQLDMPNAEKLPLGLMLMRETASNLLLAPEAIDRERGVIVSEERARASPGFKQFEAWFAHAFPGTRMITRMPIGDMDVVHNAPRERFEELYRGFYTPERTFVVVVGDIDPTAAQAEIAKAFGDWAPTTPGLPDPDLGTLQPTAGKITLHVDGQLGTSVSLGVSRPFVDRPDTSANRRDSLLRSVAHAALNTRLERIARRPESPFNGASASFGGWFNTAEIAQLEGSAKDDSRWAETLAVMDVELRKALTYGFTQDELTVVMANVRESYARAVQQDASRRSPSIAMSILSSFGSDSVYTDNASDLAWLDSVKDSVTPDAVLAALRGMWGTELPHLFVSTAAPIEGGEATVRSAFEAARAQPVAAEQAVVTRAWDYTDFGTPGTVVSSETIEDLGVTNIRFANNVRLVVRPSNFEPGRVRVAVRIGEGSLTLTGANPVMQALAINSAFSAGGLGRFDADELERTLAGRTISTGFNVGDADFGFGASTTPQDLLLQMQVFAAFTTDAAWRPEGFERLRSFKDALYRQIRSTPGSVWGLEAGLVLGSNNPRAAFPTPEQFSAQTLEEARAPVDAALRSGAIEVVIVGDTTVETATDVVARTFGALPTRAEAPARHPETERVVFTPGRGTTTLTHDGRADQALGMIYWPMRDYGDGAEVRAIRLVEQILQLKLTEVIREEVGSTYSPGTVWSPSTVNPGYGYLGAVMELKPDDVDPMIARVEAIAADLAAGNIDEDLFRRARTPLLADIIETRANNPWWISWLSGSSFNPVRLDIIRNGQQHYEQVTLEQVKALARQYLDPSKARIVRILPSEQAQAAQ